MNPVSFRFAHMSDCHIGSWRDPKMRDIGIDSFLRATDICIEKKVDFILICGDLFNTSLPPIDNLKKVTSRLKELRDTGIGIYFVAGSHDYSPSGKTMLDVLEKADLMTNVAKGSVEDRKLKLNFTIDRKTGVKIAGLPGKKGMLERSYYENLVTENLEKEDGYKIFLFHTALTELKPQSLEKMNSCPISLLPKGFDYYAGGHVHARGEYEVEGYKKIVYPGPLFPNSFKEMEELKAGSFVIVTFENGTQRIEGCLLQTYNVENIKIDCDNKTIEEVENSVLEEIKNKELFNTIVTIRLGGTLRSGKPSEINFHKIFNLLYEKGAYFVMKSTFLLRTKEFEEIKIESKSIEELESNLIKEHLNQLKVEFLKDKDEERLIAGLMDIFSKEKLEGERNQDFERRLIMDFKRAFDI